VREAQRLGALGHQQVFGPRDGGVRRRDVEPRFEPIGQGFEHTPRQRVGERGVCAQPICVHILRQPPADRAVDRRATPHHLRLKVGDGRGAEHHRRAHLAIHQRHRVEGSAGVVVGVKPAALLQHEDRRAAARGLQRGGGPRGAAADDHDVGAQV
jgi:hypothetical protein